MTGALDGDCQLALLLCAHRSDARRDDLATLGHEALQQTNVLVIDPGSVLRREGAALATAEKGSCHVLSPYSPCAPKPVLVLPPSSRSRRPRPRSRSWPLRIITDGPCSCASTRTVM